MLPIYTTEVSDQPTPLIFITKDTYDQWLSEQPESLQTWLKSTGFKAEPGLFSLVPGAGQSLEKVICCINGDAMAARSLPLLLPEGVYELPECDVEEKMLHIIAWGLGSYQFTKYKNADRAPAKLYVTQEQAEHASVLVESSYLTQDLINTPTEEMGPSELSAAMKALSKECGASFTETVGAKLLKYNYPLIHAVGRACDDEPRLLDLRWGDTSKPKVTLVGKGVCFDTGGLDIKGGSGMALMKKDMGGAAHVLGLARMIMKSNLPVCLRVLIPAVENSVSGNAFRPGDVFKSRKGLTVEIGNTDAEGRLVLADALAEASEEKPDLLIDMATLTGAARIALGQDLPAMFCNEDQLAQDVVHASDKVSDPVWRMPLFAKYREYLNSTIADINNNSSERYGGAIAAALFLQEFVEKDIPWLHFDIMAYNTRPKPGKMMGAEAMALRALFSYLKNRFD